MYIEGPFNITVQDDGINGNRELHLSFKPAFVQKELFERVEEFQQYIDQLDHDLSKLTHDNPDRLGMETILDICKNLSEHIAKDELDLNEQIVIEIQPSIKIEDTVSGGPTIH